MKPFLLLFIFTSFLFGQDVLYLKSGEFKKGTCIEKVGNDIVFQVEGENIYTKFSIDLVEIIETNNSKYYYPFDIETKIEEDKSGFWKRAAEAYLTGNKDEFLRQNMKPSPIPSYMVIPCTLILVSILVVLGGGGVSM